MNITDPIRHNAQTQPKAVALLKASGDAISYRILDMQIDRCANRAHALGLKRGDIVGMQITGRDEGFGLIVALGLARAGVITTEYTLPPHHYAAVLPRETHAMPEGVRQIPLNWSWLSDDGADPAYATADDSDLIFRIFATSGTTGRSRSPAVTHAQMAVRMAASQTQILTMPGRDIVLCALGFDCNFGMRVALGTLSGGGSLLVGERFRERIVEVVLAHKVTGIVTSPVGLQHMISQIPDGVGPLPSLERVVVGGSQLPVRLWDFARRRVCANIVSTFGASETSLIANGRFEDMSKVSLCVGRLVAGAEAQAVDDDHNPLPPGIQGVLRFRTAGDASYYFDDPESTQQTFRDGWFYSGDIGSVTDEGMLCIAGRTGEFINSGGVKSNPRLVEEILLAHADVQEAAAFPVRNAFGLAEPWAAIVSDKALDIPSLGQHCWAHLGGASPKYFLRVPSLPRNANGKVVNALLIELAENLRAEQSAALQPMPR